MSLTGGGNPYAQTQVLKDTQVMVQGGTKHFHTISAAAAANVTQRNNREKVNPQFLQDSCQALSSALSDIPESPKRLNVTPQENNKASS
jgi:hypothetical protein